VTEATLWTNFYCKLSEIDSYSSKNPNTPTDQTMSGGVLVDSLTPEALFARELEKVL